jgi:hypothetical protein
MVRTGKPFQIDRGRRQAMTLITDRHRTDVLCVAR